MILSGLEKYILSKIHGRSLTFGNGLMLSILLSVITIISPFSTSLTYFAPIISNAHVSEASTGAPFKSHNTNGLIPYGSLTPISFLFVKITKAYAP